MNNVSIVSLVLLVGAVTFGLIAASPYLALGAASLLVFWVSVNQGDE